MCKRSYNSAPSRFNIRLSGDAKISLHLAQTFHQMLDIRRYQDLMSKDLDESEIIYENDVETDEYSPDDNNVSIRLYN